MNWPLAEPPPARRDGRWWRMLSPRWARAPLSGDGAAGRGGRWNAAGQAALYLSADHATAIAEYLQDLVRPGTLTPYDIDVDRLLDLTDAGVRTTLGLDGGFLRQPWKRQRDIDRVRPPGWDFAIAAAAAGWRGLIVPSATGRAANLVLWRWHDGPGGTVAALDPAGDLPRDQASWS